MSENEFWEQIRRKIKAAFEGIWSRQEVDMGGKEKEKFKYISSIFRSMLGASMEHVDIGVD